MPGFVVAYRRSAVMPPELPGRSESGMDSWTIQFFNFRLFAAYNAACCVRDGLARECRRLWVNSRRRERLSSWKPAAYRSLVAVLHQHLLFLFVGLAAFSPGSAAAAIPGRASAPGRAPSDALLIFLGLAWFTCALDLGNSSAFDQRRPCRFSGFSLACVSSPCRSRYLP